MEFPAWWAGEDQVTIHTYEGLSEPFKLPTGLDSFDKWLQGGLPSGRLIEIYGESGTGKTNFAISLICKAASLYTQSWYISTFKPISRSRLEQVGVDPALLTIRHCSSLAEVDQTLFADLFQALLKGDPVRLVVIDPVSGLINEAFSEEHASDTLTGPSRSQYMTRQAVIMRHLSQKYGFICLFLNTLVSDTQGGVRPSLGFTWSNLINDRFRLLKDPSGRFIQPVLGPNTPSDSLFPFLITNTGLQAG